MNSILIDKDIPVPTRNEWKEPLDQLEIEDSFSFDKALRSNVASCVSGHFHSLTNKRFTIKKDPKDPKNKLRVWRVEDNQDKE